MLVRLKKGTGGGRVEGMRCAYLRYLSNNDDALDSGYHRK